MHKGRLGVAVLLLFAAVFCFSGCNIKSDEKTLFVRDTDPAYIDLLRDIAPDCTVRDGKGLSSLLSSVDGEDKAFALFDVQARASKDAGTGGIWYEHFATAAVIAVDRSRFDGEIKGWRDLENISCPVGFTSRYERMLFAAVSYGLEKNYMSGEEKDYMKLFIPCGGADDPRPIKMRQRGSDGKWFLWEQYLLTGVRTPKEADPWA